MKLLPAAVQSIGVGLTMLVAMHAAGTAGDDPTAFDIPHPGSGMILSVHSFGPIGFGSHRGAYVTSADSTVRIDAAKPYAARWTGDSRIVASERFQGPDKKWVTRVTRFDSNGTALGEWDIAPFENLPAPSPNGRYLLWEELGAGMTRMSVHIALATAGPESVRESGRSQTFSPLFLMGSPIWSGSSAAIALPIGVSTPRGRYYPRLHILDLDAGEIRRVRDALPPRERERGGTQPLLWTEDGLFAAAGRRILRCGTDREGQGCSLVHEFDDWLRVKGGTSVGGGRAYVLVRDVRPDPLGYRPNELHEVDLRRGDAKLLLKLPQDVYLESIEWTPDGP